VHFSPRQPSKAAADTRLRMGRNQNSTGELLRECFFLVNER
jgi:hypothetical protein